MYYKINIFQNNGESFFNYENEFLYSNKKLQTIRRKYQYKIDLFLSQYMYEIGPIVVYIPTKLMQLIKPLDVLREIESLINIKDIDICIDEITLRDYYHLCKNNYLSSDDIMTTKLMLTFNEVFDKYPFQMIDEYIVEQMDEEEVDKTLNEISMSEKFDDEIKNIRATQQVKMFNEHPILYVIEVYSQAIKEIYINVLISELRKKNILLSNRVISLTLGYNFEESILWNSFYEEAIGCTMVISVDPMRSTLFGDQLEHQVLIILLLVEKYRHLILFIFDVSNSKEFIKYIQKYKSKNEILKNFKEPDFQYPV